jgi:heme exporter protein B
VLKLFGGMLARDLRLALRRRGDVLNTLAFFVMVASLFPLGVGAEPKLLTAIAPGILWVAALLAAMLSFSRLFDADFADGTLEQMVLAPEPLFVIVLAKVLAHWITTGLLLSLLAPLLALQYGLGAGLIAVLCGSLVLGTPLLSLLGAVAAALTLGLRGAGVLSALLLLPLFVPVLIFGAGAVSAADSGLGAQPHLLLLAGGLLLALPLAPWAASAALRLAVDSA